MSDGLSVASINGGMGLDAHYGSYRPPDTYGIPVASYMMSEKMGNASYASV